MMANSISNRTTAALLVALGAAFLLTACGDGGGDQTAATVPNPPGTPNPPGNMSPTISGAPMTSVMQGTAYLFAPTASDPDNGTLTFTINGKPAWATFNGSTGRLSGTPGVGDVGTSGSITISVSDGSASASLAAFTIQVVAVATGSATLTWTPPTTNTDGSALANLKGYKVYWGTTQGTYPNSVTLNNPGLATYVVDQLTPATWYFVVTAINTNNVESQQSNVGSKTVL